MNGNVSWINTMPRIKNLQASSLTGFHSQLVPLPIYRPYSAKHSSNNEGEDADFDAARQWYLKFGKISALHTKIARTTFSRSSGPGGQKVNKTSSKALTEWPLPDLLSHVPKVLHQSLRDSRYYVASSNSIKIQCDSHRGQSENEAETHKRLAEELSKMYTQRVPGVTDPETKKRVEQLKKADNSARIKMKKLHSSKKRARSSGGRFND